MVESHYAKSFKEIRDELLSDFPGMKARVVGEQGSLTAPPSKDPEKFIRQRLRLLGLAKKNLLDAAELRADPKRILHLLAEPAAKDYVRPFAIKACRLVVLAVKENKLTQPTKLWGEVKISEHKFNSDGQMLNLWNRLVPALRKHQPTAFASTEDDPWSSVNDCADACTVLAKLVAGDDGADVRQALADPTKQGVWSEFLQLKEIAAIIGCSDKMRSIKPTLIDMNSDIHTYKRGRYSVRLDTMADPYKSKFKAGTAPPPKLKPKS